MQPDFPVEHMIRLDEMVNRTRWIVPVLPKDSLEILLDAAIKLCQAGEDTQHEHCQTFFKHGLKESFTKLMTTENGRHWKNEIHKCIFSNAKLLVELVVAKLSQKSISYECCLPLFDSLAYILTPDCEFHKINRLQSPTLSKSDDTIFAKPVLESEPRGWLVDLVNIFGNLHGFERLLQLFTEQHLPSIKTIATLIKPFGLCSNVLTNQTVTKYLIPTIQCVMALLDNLSDEELKELWKSEELSTILIAIEEIVYVCPEHHATSIANLERIQTKMRHKVKHPSGEGYELKSEHVVDKSGNNMSNDKIEIKFTKKQIKTIEDTFTCVICIGTLDKPMFATCCRTLIACKSCLDQWYRTSSRCPKCRTHKAKDMAFEVVGIGDAISALPFLNDSF